MTENQKLWIEALRSGKYEQGTGVLESKGKFCCLGVACKVAEKHGVKVTYTPLGELEGGSLAQQKDVKTWLGLASTHGIAYNREFFRLTYLNDRYGKSFEEIADIIEAHPEWYFVNEENDNETM